MVLLVLRGYCPCAAGNGGVTMLDKFFAFLDVDTMSTSTYFIVWGVILLVGFYVCKSLHIPTKLCVFYAIGYGFFFMGIGCDGDFSLLMDDAIDAETYLDPFLNSLTDGQLYAMFFATVAWVLSLGGCIPGQFKRKRRDDNA